MRRTIIILGLLLSGCGPLWVQPGEPKPGEPKPDVKPTVETKWTVLADSIDNPDTLPKKSSQLSLMLTHLRSLGKITDQEVAAVKACVPKIDEMEIELTKEHADKIRGLK
jgi:hypothetical protein